MRIGSKKKVAIHQQNATVARLMRDFLEERYEVELLQRSAAEVPGAHLLIVDVESSPESAERWLRHGDGREVPVLVCGVATSRKDYAERPWLSRPFTSEQLLRHCAEVLGGSQEVELFEEEEESIPPPIRPGGDFQDFASGEVAAISEVEASPSSVWRLGQETEKLFDRVEFEGSTSMIVEIEDLSASEGVGGVLVGKGARRSYRESELAREDPWSDIPDTSVEEIAASTSKKPLRERMPSGVVVSPQLPSSSADVTTVSTWEDAATGDFSSVHRISTLLAEHWDRLGLTARPADRADRLQRVLTAMWRGGMDGLLEELKRIPAACGFSGRLETLPLVDLFHVIRDRRLRGRLEVSLEGASFVLFVDRGILEEIDSLGESTERLFLKGLLRAGALDEQSYRRYQQLGEEGSVESIEILLRRERAVDEGQWLAARKYRARRLLRRLCEGERGTFAFIEMALESGQPWPNQGLGLVVDEMLLEVLRGGILEPAEGQDSGSMNLVSDRDRAASMGHEVLTESERRALEFFSEARSVASARRELDNSEEPVEDVLGRLQRLELLRSLGKGNERKGETRGGNEGKEHDDRLLRPTKVGSGWEAELPDERHDGRGGWSMPQVAGPEEETLQEVGFSAGVPKEFDSWEDEVEKALSGSSSEPVDESDDERS